jgi:hypothetical protein
MSSTATSNRPEMLNLPQRFSNRSDLTGLSLAEEIAFDQSGKPVDWNCLERDISVDIPSHEEVLSKHYTALTTFLMSPLDSVGDEKAQSRPNRGQDKLSQLSSVQLQDLSTDVFDELIRRRETDSPSYLDPRDHFHPKRNQARQKLSTLPSPQFRDLAADIFHELERRFPQFAAKDTSQVDDHASVRGPLITQSVRGPPSFVDLRRVIPLAPEPPGGDLPPTEEHASTGAYTTLSGSPEQPSKDGGKRSFEGAGAPDPFDQQVLSQQAPDELLEAMKSLQNLSFLLNLEPKLISFVEDSKAPYTDIILYPSSSFYLILAQRLADYYHLSFQAGRRNAVRIFRTPFCRLPPSLKSISSPRTAGLTPPPVPPTTTRTGSGGDIRFGHSRASSETSYLSKEKYVYYKTLSCCIL